MCQQKCFCYLWLSLLLFIPYCQLSAQANHSIAFTGDYSYLNLRSDKAIKPTGQLTLELFAWEKDWTIDNYSPTLAGNTQHKGYAIALSLGKLYGCVQFDSGIAPHNVYYNLNLLTPGWHHFALTYDGISSRLMVDGAVVAMLSNSKPIPIAQPDSSITFMIGAETRYNGLPYMHASYFFKGRIDDLRIWDIAKTPTQIRQDLLRIPKAGEEHLLASFSFDTIINQQIHDLGRYKVHAQLISGPTLLPSDSPATNWIAPSLTTVSWITWYQLFILASLLAGISWLLWRFKNQRMTIHFWFIAFSMCSIINALAGYWAPYELFTHREFVPFWNTHHLHCIYFLSMGCLFKFFQGVVKEQAHHANRYYRRFLDVAPIVSLALAINALAVPVVYSKFIIVGVSLLMLLSILYYIITKISYSFYVSIGGLGILAGTLCYALPALGIIGNIVRTPQDFFTVHIIEFIGFGMLALKTNGMKAALPFPVTELHEVEDTDLAKIQTLLSKREWEVYSLLLEGNTDKEIAEKLFISLNTVKTHVKKIYLKLDVRNRLEAVTVAKVKQQS
jgi:DNA-binding CsgD family transcriptional regulator